MSYLDDRHPRADIDEQVGENVRLGGLEAELRVRVLGVNKGLVGDVPQNKVAALDQAGHLVLLVHAAERDDKNSSFPPARWCGVLSGQTASSKKNNLEYL